MRDLPGVDPDGKTPGGLEVAGNVEAATFTQDGEPLQVSIPGVTPDGGIPAGIDIAGNIIVDQDIAADLNGAGTGHTFQTKTGGGILINKDTDDFAGLQISLSTGSSGTEITMDNPDISAGMWRIYADGSETLKKGLGQFGHAAPSAASAITGALSTVTDAAAKAVITSIISALTADGGATDGTT